jgi:hypothetical protein
MVDAVQLMVTPVTVDVLLDPQPAANRIVPTIRDSPSRRVISVLY